MSTVTKFNVRVYFLLFNESNQVLVSDEIISGQMYTKFPGGGLEMGEGTIECAQREGMEELGQEIGELKHFYTSDFFIQSVFDASNQVLCVYYTAKLASAQRFKTTEQKFAFVQKVNDEEAFRWVSINLLDTEEFAFPADRQVIRMLQDR